MGIDIAKVFTSGNSQAVRLPRKYQVSAETLFIRKEGESIILTPKPNDWTGFMQGCEPLSEDFSVQGAPLPSDIERDDML